MVSATMCINYKIEHSGRKVLRSDDYQTTNREMKQHTTETTQNLQHSEIRTSSYYYYLKFAICVFQSSPDQFPIWFISLTIFIHPKHNTQLHTHTHTDTPKFNNGVLTIVTTQETGRDILLLCCSHNQYTHHILSNTLNFVPRNWPKL